METIFLLRVKNGNTVLRCSETAPALAIIYQLRNITAAIS
jgi:hypothetical protein